MHARRIEIVVQAASARRPARSPSRIRIGRPPDYRGRVSAQEDGWRIEAREAGSVELFEVAAPAVEQCRLTYRADIRTEAVEGGTYLEMWCRLPGQGEFFSKGRQRKAKGTTGWASHEVSFYLKAGQRPDLIRLNVGFDGPGTLWLRKAELEKTPLR